MRVLKSNHVWFKLAYSTDYLRFVLFKKLFFLFAGCLPPILVAEAEVSPSQEVYSPGQSISISCIPGNTLMGNPTATCSETTFMFDDINFLCIPSKP